MKCILMYSGFVQANPKHCGEDERTEERENAFLPQQGSFLSHPIPKVSSQMKIRTGSGALRLTEDV